MNVTFDGANLRKKRVKRKRFQKINAIIVIISKKVWAKLRLFEK